MNDWFIVLLGLCMILIGGISHEYIKDNFSNNDIPCYDKYNNEMKDLTCKGINNELILIDSIMAFLSVAGLIPVLGGISLVAFKVKKESLVKND